MQRVILAFALLGVSLFGAPPAAPGGAPGSALKPIVIHDLGDAARTIPDPNSRATVLLFIAHDCPVSNGYSPEMARICAKYGPRRVTFFMVYADSQVTPDDARKHAKDYGYTCPLILDSAFKLAHWAGATVTPRPSSSRRTEKSLTAAASTISTTASVRLVIRRPCMTCATRWTPCWPARPSQIQSLRRSAATSPRRNSASRAANSRSPARSSRVPAYACAGICTPHPPRPRLPGPSRP